MAARQAQQRLEAATSLSDRLREVGRGLSEELRRRADVWEKALVNDRLDALDEAVPTVVQVTCCRGEGNDGIAAVDNDAQASGTGDEGAAGGSATTAVSASAARVEIQQRPMSGGCPVAVAETGSYEAAAVAANMATLAGAGMMSGIELLGPDRNEILSRAGASNPLAVAAQARTAIGVDNGDSPQANIERISFGGGFDGGRDDLLEAAAMEPLQGDNHVHGVNAAFPYPAGGGHHASTVASGTTRSRSRDEALSGDLGFSTGGGFNLGGVGAGYSAPGCSTNWSLELLSTVDPDRAVKRQRFGASG